MKNYLIIASVILLTGFASFGQRETFDCDALNKAKIMSAYNRLKSYGLEYVVVTTKGEKKDIMEFAIDFLKPNELRQICINAWGDVQNNGAEYCYDRYVRFRGYVSKSTYMGNIDYFEMLHSIRTLVGNSY